MGAASAPPLSPETGMFPDTLVAPFIVAPEVGELADDVIAAFDEFRPIRAAMDDPGLRIRGVLHHELTHVEVGETDDDGKLKVSLREHDVEEFSQTARRFGPRRLNHRQLFEAFLAWEQAHKPAEPTKLRAVTGFAPSVGVAPTVLVDEPDLRPAGEVNADELKGAAARDVQEAERSTDGADDDIPDLPF